MTVQDLMTKLNTSRDRVSKLLHHARDKGRLQVTREQRENIVGVLQWVPCYRLKP